MRVYLSLIRKDLFEQWRNKKILIMLIIFLFVAIASPIIAKLTPEILKSISIPGLTINLPPPTYADSIDQFIKNISQMSLLVLVFVVAGAVSDEKNRKTLEILLTKPVSRTLFILSKFKAYFISIITTYVVAITIFYLYTVSTFSTFNLLNFLVMTDSVLLYILMIVSITILASTLFNSSLVAGGIGFASHIIFGTFFDFIEPLKKYSPNTIFSMYQQIVKNGWSGDLLLPTITIISVIIFSVILSVIMFHSQEIER